MTAETITFFGGPRDGQSIGWRGGDTAEFPIMSPLEPASFAAVAPRNEPEKYERALYVRSRRSRHIFVYQP